jgi:hypothetical protein
MAHRQGIQTCGDIYYSFTSREELSSQVLKFPLPASSAEATQRVSNHPYNSLGPLFTAGKKAHVQWEQQVARRTTRIAHIAQRLDRVGEMEEATGVYAETKIEELAERTSIRSSGGRQQWDKIQRKEREASIPKIEQSRSITEEFVQTLTLIRTPESE